MLALAAEYVAKLLFSWTFPSSVSCSRLKYFILHFYLLMNMSLRGPGG